MSMSTELCSSDVYKLTNGLITGTCQMIHPGSGCITSRIDRFFQAYKTAFKYYIPIHFVPLFAIHWRKLLADPGNSLLRASVGCCRSAGLISCMSGFGQLMFCVNMRLFGSFTMSTIKTGSFLGGVVGAFVETPARRCEMAVWLIPRLIPVFVNFLKKRGIPINLKKYFIPIFCLAMAIMNYGLETDKSTVRYSSLFGKYFGQN